jgi:hypothetical protein
MRDILIIFAILLVLLVILSSLGGSIATKKEYYVNVTTKQEEPITTYLTQPSSLMRVQQEYVAQESKKSEAFIEPFDATESFSQY